MSFFTAYWVLATINRRLYILNRLKRQGLDSLDVSVVFNVIVTPKLLYACQTVSRFLSSSDLRRLQALLKSLSSSTKLRVNISESFLMNVIIVCSNRLCRVLIIACINYCLLGELLNKDHCELKVVRMLSSL
jgi:hypothetical protein